MPTDIPVRRDPTTRAADTADFAIRAAIVVVSIWSVIAGYGVIILVVKLATLRIAGGPLP